MLKEIVVRMAVLDLPDLEVHLENVVSPENLEQTVCQVRLDRQDHRYVNKLFLVW